MQSQNSHIEDMVRQAAEFNPVKAKGADWNNVYSKLVNNEAATVKPQEKSKKYLFLLVFLLSSLLCNEFYYILYSDEVKSTLNKKLPILLPEVGTNDQYNQFDNSNHKKSVSSRSLKNYSKPVLTFDIPGIYTKSKDHTLSQPVYEQVETVIVPKGEVDYMNNKIPNVVNESALGKTAKENYIGQLKLDDQSIHKKTSTAKKKLLYAAFLLGPDLSTVKFSEIKAVGHSIGITLGMQLTDRFSIETGAFLNQKKYVAEGEYFNAEKLYLPDHSKLLNVSGYCNMFEIPVNIRYNVADKNNYKIFALAGLSSYLVQKENYDYDYSRYNNLYSGSKSYSQSSNELFNVVNLAAGFEKRVGKTTALRIEPYVKLPVKGMGVGDMRLSSAGVLVGVRYPF